jgi:CRP-like cAMP-binding protein
MVPVASLDTGDMEHHHIPINSTGVPKFGSPFWHRVEPANDFLRELPLFAGCSRRDIRRAGSLMSSVSVTAGQRLIVQACEGHEFMILTSGTAKVFRGKEQIAEYSPGDFAGEIALLAHVPRTATVIASDSGRVAVLNEREFVALRSINEKVAARIYDIAVKRSEGTPVVL